VVFLKQIELGNVLEVGTDDQQYIAARRLRPELGKLRAEPFGQLT
jgi:hypothetical protein